MFHAKILHINLGHSSFRNPRDQLLFLALSVANLCWVLTCSTFSGVLLFTGLPEHGLLSTDSQPSLKFLCHTFICAALIASSLKYFWILWTVSVEECSSLTQNLIQIHCSTCSVILNVMATQCTSSLNGVYHPHWLVQWSHHYSHMHSPVHCPWLPDYIDIVQTVLIVLTIAGLFLDRPGMYIRYIYDSINSSKFKKKKGSVNFTINQYFPIWITKK